MRRYLLLSLMALALTQAPGAQEREFRLAVGDEKWPKILTWDESMNYEGLYARFFGELSRRMGWKGVITPLPWLRAQEYAEKGLADALIAVASPPRLAYAYASDEPVFSLYFTLYARRDHPRMEEIAKIRSLEDILALDLTVVTNRGNGWHEANVEALGIPTVLVNNDDTILKFLAAGRADLVIDTPLSMAPRLKEMGLSNQIASTGVHLDETRLYLLLSKKSAFKDRWPEINRQVSELVAGAEYQEALRVLYGF